MQQRTEETEQLYEGIWRGVLKLPNPKQVTSSFDPKPLTKDGQEDIFEVTQGT